MVRKTTLITLLLIGFTLLPPARAGATGRPVLGLGAQAGVAIADAPGDFFIPKAQAVGALSFLLEVPVFGNVPVGVGLQFHATTGSSLSGGWGYRSHWGGGLRLSTGYGWSISDPSRPLRLKLGVSAGASLNFDLYTWTTLFFSYPGVFLQPYLELNNTKWKNHSIAVVLPIDYYFRRDLEFFGSVGIGAVWRITLQ